MINLFLNSLKSYGLSQNVFVTTSYGALLLNREKKYRFFRYLNTFFMCLGIYISAIAIYFLNQFVLVKFDLVEIKLGVGVFFVGLYILGVTHRRLE